MILVAEPVIPAEPPATAPRGHPEQPPAALLEVHEGTGEVDCGHPREEQIRNVGRFEGGSSQARQLGKGCRLLPEPLGSFQCLHHQATEYPSILEFIVDYSDHYNTLSEFSNSQSVCKQVLMKHSEKKLMTLQKMVELEEEIMSLDERYRMTVEDVQGRSEQICGLIFEYEDLEQLSQQMDQSLINSHQGALLSKKGLIETQKKY